MNESIHKADVMQAGSRILGTAELSDFEYS